MEGKARTGKPRRAAAPKGAAAKGAATLTVGGKTLELPLLVGTMGTRAVDISALRAATGLVAYDPGLANTSVCRSEITHVDGEKGVLLLRGYPIEELTEHCSFVEVAYLLLHGKLPTERQGRHFSELLNRHSMIHEDMLTFFGKFAEGAHPMAVLSAMVVSLSSFYPELQRNTEQEEMDITATRLLSKLRTIAAFSYKKSIGEPFVYPSFKFSYCENFLNMMFSSPVSRYKAEPYEVEAMNKLLILHADHEQNASTTSVRVVGSTGSNLYACISAGCCALWGPLHGGANQAVIEMLEKIMASGMPVADVLRKARDKTDPFKLMGFGHRIYKTYDPRARIARELCFEVLRRKKRKDPLFDLAKRLEEAALKDPYFTERHLYPNIDFYTGIIYRALGFPKEMFTVLFALGRLPGWIAHWMEMRRSPGRIMRPRQLYTGPTRTAFVPIAER
jgi:citrate synthase